MPFLSKLFSAFSKVDTISTKELEDLLQSHPKTQVLDVRTRVEFQEGHIKNARNVPVDTIVNYKGIKDQKVYIICHSGIRSRRASQKLRNKGYHAIHVKGGMMAWSGPIVRSL
ncbi:rhodanese-like domain-containing protein [Streptococcus uberis]|uniref:rhodanese-like domain-containing protein n=1 Tax=Streptococcus uberis TaxID=1349 RepID=UPI003891E14E